MVKNGHSQSTQCNIQVITAMQAYQHKSVEELRLEDYARGNKGPGSGGGVLGGGMGGGLGSLGGGGMFGGGAAASSPFGAKPAATLGGFGQPAAGGFGQATTGFGGAATGGAFGAPAAGGAFGAPAAGGAFGAPATGGFGQPSLGGGFGQAAAGSGGFGQPVAGGAFGQPAASGGFGQPAAGAFGAPASGGLGGFGSTNTGASPFGAATNTGGAFGAPATGGFGQPASGGAFGAPAASTGFGGGFGQTAAKPATGGFGSLGGTSGGFGSSTLGGGFGSTAAPAAGAFGSTLGSGGFGSPPATTGGFGSSTLGGGFGQPATSGGFGQPAAAPASNGFGSFGSPLGGGLGGGLGSGAAGGFGAAKPGGFGAPATTPATSSFGGLGGFGNTGGFGSTTPAASGGLNFSLPSTTMGGFGSGGFGNTSGLSGGFGQTAQPQINQFSANGVQLSNIQQQEQLLLQVAALQHQQQEQNVAERIQMLRRKKEELTQTGTLVVADIPAEPKGPNLFSGFIATKTQGPAYYKTSPRSTARIMPRGVRGLASPAPQTQSGSSQFSITPISTGREVNTPYKTDNLLSPEPYSLGRNAKKLIVSAFKSPMPDPTEDLPPMPNSSARTPQSTAQQTPHRMDVSNTGARNGGATDASRRSGVTYSSDTDFNKSRSGEATGLTPAHTATPYYARRGETPRDEDGGNNASFASPVSFRLSPKENSRTSLGRTPRPVSPLEEDEPNSSAAPILTRQDYYTCPDISILQKYSTRELSKVRQFTVFRPDYGKIEWIGETDVRNLNLDEVVKIEKKEVFVYEDVTPVPEGVELNKPAVVTLYNVFPKEGSTEKKKTEFYRKLQDFCETNEADFISYDRNTGDWVFGVKHFSRYGIADSDDEDDEPRTAAAAAEMEVAADAWPENSPKAKAVNLTNPFDLPTSELAAHNILKLRTMLTSNGNGTNAPRSRVVDLSPRKTPGGDYYSSVIGTADKRSVSKRLVDTPEEVHGSGDGDSPPLTRRRVDDMLRTGWFGEQASPQAAAPREDKSHHLTLEQVRLASRASKTFVSESFASYQAFHLAEDSPCMKIMMQVKAKAARATGVVLDTSAAAFTQGGLRNANQTSSVGSLQKGITNYALSMGRSFRVGWSKDGKIVHAGKFTFAPVTDAAHSVGSVQRIAVEKVDTMRWTRNYKPDSEAHSAAPETSLEGPLLAMLSNAHQNVAANKMNESETAAQRIVSASIAKLPLWQLPAADPSQLHEYVPFLNMLKSSMSAYQAHAPNSRHPDWTVGKALELIDATYGQEKTFFSADASTRAVELIPLYEDRQQYAPEVWERRRAMLSSWIESVTSTQGEILFLRFLVVYVRLHVPHYHRLRAGFV